MPWLFDRNEIYFALELIVDALEQGLPFFLGQLKPSSKIIVLKEVFVLKTCTVDSIACELLYGKGFFLVFFLLLFLVFALLLIAFLLLF